MIGGPNLKGKVNLIEFKVMQRNFILNSMFFLEFGILYFS